MKKRVFNLELGERAEDAEGRVVEASLSSDTPVRRKGGNEILSHDPEAVDLSRAPLPLLAGHDSSRLPIGIVEDLRLEGGRLRGRLRFGASRRSSEIWEDVRAGILRSVSIGYEVLKTARKGGSYLVTRWTPYEVSLVALPADVSVGIGRNHDSMKGKTMDKNDLLKRQDELAGEIEALAQRDELGDDDQARFDELKTEAATIARRLEMLAEADKLRQPEKVREKPRPRIQVENRAAGLEDHGFKTLGEFTRAVVEGRDERLQKRTMNTGTPSEGGFIIPPAYGAPILDMALEQSILGSRATVYRTDRSTLTVPAISDTDHSASRGGLSATWTAEGGTMNPDDIELRSLEFKPYKLTLLLKATREFVDDAPNSEAFIRSTLASEIRWAVDNYCILNGTGAGQPLSIFNSSAIKSVAKEGGQAADTFLWENATKMDQALNPAAQGQAFWLLSPSLKAQVYTMAQAVGTGGGLVWSQPAGGGKGLPLLDHPIIWSEHTNVLGDKGDAMLINPKGYALCIRQDLRLEASKDVYFESDHVAFRAIVRIDGMPIQAGTMTLADGSTEVADFVTLDAR